MADQYLLAILAATAAGIAITQAMSNNTTPMLGAPTLTSPTYDPSLPLVTQTPRSAPIDPPYRVTLAFGSTKPPFYSASKPHVGVDLAPFPGSEGEPLYAIFNGVCLVSHFYGNYGNLVRTSHVLPYSVTAKNISGRVRTIPAGSRFEFWYGHLSELDVFPQHNVSAGQKIGKIGSTGLASGPHVHLECRHRGELLDPVDVLIMAGVWQKSQLTGDV